MKTRVIGLGELIQLSLDIVKKYQPDDPELWGEVGNKIDSIVKNGSLESDIDSDDELSNKNLLYIISRKYSTSEHINEMQPLFELWQTASHPD